MGDDWGWVEQMMSRTVCDGLRRVCVSVAVCLSVTDWLTYFNDFYDHHLGLKFILKLTFQFLVNLHNAQYLSENGYK